MGQPNCVPPLGDAGGWPAPQPGREEGWARGAGPEQELGSLLRACRCTGVLCGVRVVARSGDGGLCDANETAPAQLGNLVADTAMALCKRPSAVSLRSSPAPSTPSEQRSRQTPVVPPPCCLCSPAGSLLARPASYKDPLSSAMAFAALQKDADSALSNNEREFILKARLVVQGAGQGPMAHRLKAMRAHVRRRRRRRLPLAACSAAHRMPLQHASSVPLLMPPGCPRTALPRTSRHCATGSASTGARRTSCAPRASRLPWTTRRAPWPWAAPA